MCCFANLPPRRSNACYVYNLTLTARDYDIAEKIAETKVNKKF